MHRFLKALVGAAMLLAPLVAPRFVAHAQATEMSVDIAHPVEGQILYAGPRVPQYVIPVNGKVSLAQGSVSDVRLELDIYQGTRLTGRLTGSPETDGSFQFLVTVNPDAPIMELKTDKKDCAECHDQSTFADLPPGASALILKVTGPGGQRVTTERHIVVDRSGWAEIVVEVNLADDSVMSIQGLPILAITRFPVTANTATDVQTRYFKGMTDENGRAVLEVESLAWSPTEYLISIPPAVIDGTLVASVEPAGLTLPPGAASAEPVTLEVRGTRGRVAGQLQVPPGADVDPVTVRAIELPEGQAHSTESRLYAYVLGDLPIGRYLVTPDVDQLAERGFSSETRVVDLAASPVARADLVLEPSTTTRLHGILRAAGSDEPLLFGWVVDRESGQAARIDPTSGEFSLSVPANGSRVVELLAPGYWSQVRVAEAGNGRLLDFSLVERPGLRRVLLDGGGQLSLPAETVAEPSRGELSLVQGWAWGRIGSAEYTVRLPDGRIVVAPNSRFAIERPLDRSPWLYVLEGSASVLFTGQERAVAVGPDQMLVLTPDSAVSPEAATLDPAVVAALHAGEAVPLPFAAEPTVAARVRDGLARLGITVAGLFTLATYSAAILVAIGLPLLAVNTWRRARRHQELIP